jgi:hypothetical protein
MPSLILPGKFVFLPHPRCGDEEISIALQAIGAVDLVAEPQEEVTFTVVRNPFEVVRIWFDLNPYWHDFELFIKDYVHSHYIRDGKLFWQSTERVLKYEDLPEDLDNLLESLDIEDKVPLEKLPITDYRDHYSPETIALVREKFADELEELDYDF